MPITLKPLAAPATSAPAQDAPAAPNKNARRRNGCAVAAAACYVLSNLIGYLTLHHVTMFATDYALEIVGGISLLGVAMAGFYIAFCCYGARARGWSGWMGSLIALGGVLLWFGMSIVLLFQNANTGFNTANEPRVYDNRLPWLVGVVFVVSTLALQALPRRGVERNAADRRVKGLSDA